MVLQIEKIGRDTFDRVVYRFPLLGFPTGSGIVPGLIRGKKIFISRFCSKILSKQGKGMYHKKGKNKSI